MNRVCLLLCSLVLGTSFLYADNTDTNNPATRIFEYLSKNAISVHTRIRVKDNEEVIFWDAESTLVTISGRAVKIQLARNDIRIDAYIIPFWKGEELLLVAHGELYVSDGEDESIRYEAFFKGLPVSPGEKIILFPLGVAIDPESNIYTLELEIQLLPFQRPVD